MPAGPPVPRFIILPAGTYREVSARIELATFYFEWSWKRLRPVENPPQFRPCSARTFEHRPGSTRSDDQFPSAANDVGREISKLSPYRFVFGIAGVARLELGAALLPTGETMTPARDGSPDPARREK